MAINRFIISKGERYEEDRAWQHLQAEPAINNPSYTYMIEVGSNTKPWEENYPHSRRIDEFEASDSLIISTTLSEPSNTVHRSIAEGDFLLLQYKYPCGRYNKKPSHIYHGGRRNKSLLRNSFFN